MNPRIQFLHARLWIILLYLLLLPTAGATSLREELESVLADRRLEGAEIALHVTRIEDGEVLFSRNADQPFIPASNQKIVTAVAALDTLGHDYEFITTLRMSGEVRNGSLEGDLMLIGGGDPTLGSPAIGEDPTAQFEIWAEVLKKRGIKRINGDIIVDQSLFDDMHVHPDWPRNQLVRHYSAPLTAMIFQDNCIRISVRPGRAPGTAATVEIYPPLDYIRIENTCRTGTGSNTIGIDRTEDSAGIIVWGEAMHRTGGWSGLVAAPNPSSFAGESFAYVLRTRGIEIEGSVRAKSKGTGSGENDTTLLARRRAPLTKALEIMLVDSQNLYAESLLKIMGARIHETGSWKSGADAVNSALKAREIGEENITVADGSGYSRNNRITAEAICELLTQLYKSGENEAKLKTLLPMAGAEGTLANRLTGSDHAGRVHAKSGYISRVGSLSGYARTDAGKLVAFSIMINNFRRGSNSDMRQIQDSIVKVLLEN